jgi:hypothetical protein
MRKEDAYPGMFVTWADHPGYADEDEVFQLVEYTPVDDSWSARDHRGKVMGHYHLNKASSAHKPSWASVSGGIPRIPAPTPKPDIIDQPEHYTSHPSGIEVIEITKHETFLRGNVLKYVLRAPYKGREVEDLKKAMKYLQWELDRAQLAQEPAVEEARIPSPPRAAGTPTLPV